MLRLHRTDKANTLQLLKDLERPQIILSRIGLHNSMLFPIRNVGRLKRWIQGQFSTGRVKQKWQLSQHAIGNLGNVFPQRNKRIHISPKHRQLVPWPERLINKRADPTKSNMLYQVCRAAI